MAKIVLDAERCKGCLLCTAACPKGLLVKGGDFNSLGYFSVRMDDPSGCNGCSLCAEMCPDVAIEVWKDGR